MKHKVPKYILTDTCFWIAFFDKTDENHEKSVYIMNIIEKFNIIMPWPILYEILRTKFVKNKFWLNKFERLLSYLIVIYVYDDNYRDKALLEAFGYGKRNISLVDTVIRLMLRDLSLRVDYLITYNEKDFIDICKLRKIPIYYIQD